MTISAWVLQIGSPRNISTFLQRIGRSGHALGLTPKGRLFALTRDELIEAEILFIRENAPLDFIFGMGAAVGFFIGFVVVYQILYTEVTNHMPQYATLKAMGFSDQYLLRMVVSQAMILSLLGYFPGFFMALGLYRVATNAIQMQFSMTVGRAIGVFVLTMVMCGLSAMIAIRKVKTADPADVF